MSDLEGQLSGLSFFRDLEPATVNAIAAHAQWYSLAGGWELFVQGAPPDAFYVVLAGRLIVVREGAGRDEVVGYIRSGEPVGEMALLSGDQHSASVYALRDTELLAISRDDFHQLLHDHADFASALARQVLSRSRHPHASAQRAAPRVFAFIATSPATPVEQLARDVELELRAMGVKARRLLEGDAEMLFHGYEKIESECEALLLPARVGESPWYRFVLRHADRFFVCTRRDARPSLPFSMSPSEDSPARRFRLVDLIVLPEGALSSTVREWANAVDAHRIFHWRGAETAARIARVVSGRSVGLVLSGGGARAYAHIGAVKALRERGVPIDFVAGASMGAIICACLAMGWDEAEIDRRIRDAFVASNPLGDHVLPVVALAKGARVDKRLERHFGDALIEDLATPFLCVSSDLTRGALRIHRLGSLRDALRASISLPGILPPVVDADALLVDGAVINNFPVDLMKALHRGVTVGVDVAEEATIRSADFINPPGFFTWVRRNGFRAPPPIISLLMRAATAREDGVRRANPVEVMVTPKVQGVELRDWKKYDLAVADGYQAMCDTLDFGCRPLEPFLARNTAS